MRAGGERAFVGIGANLGDCVASFVSVAVQLEREAEIVILAASPLYETPPLGPAGQPPYLNAMLELRVWLSPLDFLRKLQEIETALGRDRGPDCVKWGPRMIDLDVVLFGDRCIDHPDLVIPHPHAHERAFVLTPLAALAPELIHPRLGISIEDLARAQPDVDEMCEQARPMGWPGGRRGGDLGG